MPESHRIFRDIRVDELTGCHEWTGYQLDTGYGQVRRQGYLWRVHRLAWFLTHGPIPKGANVLHSCDNRICCNPEHLFLGTTQDNADDMVAKGRQGLGERNPGAKVTAEDVRWIRSWARAGHTRAAIASAFGLGTTSVTNIVNGLKWRHVT